MKERISRAFDDIRADDALLETTAAYLQTQRIAKSEKKRAPHVLRLAGALAALLVVAISLFGYNNIYMTPASYISMDINPSIELTLNRMDRVISVFAFNDEGETLLQQNNVIRMRYDEAVATLVTSMEQSGYFSGNALISMTVQAGDVAKEQSLQDALLQSVDVRTDAAPSSTKVEVFPVSAETREEAQSCHMSPAKYLAIQELLEVDESATLDEYSDESIHQIRKRTRQCREEHKMMGDASGQTPQNDQSSEEPSADEPGMGHGHRHGARRGQ